MPLNYSLGEEIDEAVLTLIRRTGFTKDPNLIREIATTAFKLVEDGAIRGDLKILNSTLKELRHSFRLFAPFRSFRKVSIFGSARLGAETEEYRLAERFAEELVQAGYLVITGAGPGIMEAGNRGAGDGGSFGLGIRLPIEPEANPYIRRQDRLINFKYFFTRKLIFIKESDAVALFPGGFGTMDECFELLTLLQTGKSDPRPVVLIDPPGSTFWKDWFGFLRKHQAERGLIDPNDLVFLSHVSDTAAAIEEIRCFYSNYHSSRYVGERMLVRLEKEPTDTQIEEWNDRFADIIVKGRIARAELPGEDLEDPLLATLHGISFHFDRRKTARLRELLDAINGGRPYGARTEPR
ncbi:MAG: TIGR00730 family Rossman fold protein [Candidatus Eisenbacteria bacterium]|nr:TIGR00730 family Rossman fold protein [Candidatus Latescibacterota bacterium]MBD3301450.1 TIGR00730 family Rossman fold protein [Candidatus Eisenbacteria bacterium]